MAETVPEGAEAMQRPLLAVSSTEAACQGVLYTFKTGCTFLPAPAFPQWSVPASYNSGEEFCKESLVARSTLALLNVASIIRVIT